MITTTTYVTISTLDRTDAVTVPVQRLAETLIGCYTSPTPEITTAATALAEAIASDQPTHAYAQRLGVRVRVNVKDAVDIGPAPAAPAWCLPDAAPTWDTLTKEYGEVLVCAWTRDVDGDYSGVWIRGEDQVIEGRMMRGAPRIVMLEPAQDGWSAAEARQCAAALLNAADVLDGLR